MLRSVIVEDEQMSREALKLLIAHYCPDVMVCGTASDVKSGRELIEATHPDLVFLDIEMPDGSGFKLLAGFEHIDFEVIFTTAFEQFAIKAIRSAAIDYLLKPIDPVELKNAVEKVKSIKEKKNMERRYDDLIHNIDTAKLGSKRLALSTADKIHVVEIDNIIRCESDNYYTIFHFMGGNSLMVSKTLKEVEGMLTDYDFVRTHKSHLINIRYIMNFLRDEMMIVMTDGSKVPVSRRKREKIVEIINNL